MSFHCQHILPRGLAKSLLLVAKDLDCWEISFLCMPQVLAPNAEYVLGQKEHLSSKEEYPLSNVEPTPTAAEYKLQLEELAWRIQQYSPHKEEIAKTQHPKTILDSDGNSSPQNVPMARGSKACCRPPPVTVAGLAKLAH